MTRCKDCAFWRPTAKYLGDTRRQCDALDNLTVDQTLAPEINVHVDDDSGLDVILLTPPDFGCVLGKEHV